VLGDALQNSHRSPCSASYQARGACWPATGAESKTPRWPRQPCCTSCKKREREPFSANRPTRAPLSLTALRTLPIVDSTRRLVSLAAMCVLSASAKSRMKLSCPIPGDESISADSWRFYRVLDTSEPHSKHDSIFCAETPIINSP